MIIDIVLIAAIFVALVSNRIPMSMALLLFIAAVVALGRLPFRDVLPLLADPAVFIVLCFVLFARVLSQLYWLKGFVLGKAEGSNRRMLVRFLSAVGAVSAFMPNTAVVGTFMGPASRHPKLSAHQILLPLSYMALAGGMITQFGTSANLVVVAQAEKAGIDIGFLHFLWPGLAVYLAVLVALSLASPSLLSESRNRSTGSSEEGFHIEARILAGSKLIGRSIAENELRNLDHFFVIELVRGERLISPVAPTETLQEGDTLIFVGDVRFLSELQNFDGLSPSVLPGVARRQTLYHAMVGANSNLIGRTLRESRFRSVFDASVVAIRRGNERLSGKLGEIEIRRADVLVVAAGPEFFQRGDVRPNLELLEVDDPGQRPLSRIESLIVSAFFILLVGAGAMDLIPLAFATFVLLIGALIAGWLTEREIRRNFPFDIVVLLWGSLVLGALIDKSGIDVIMAEWVRSALAGHAPFLSIIVLFVLTWILTELLSNSGAALVALPIALELAARLNLPPEAFVMTVAFGASASFIIPFGYQTHVMVLTPGSYRLLDFVKLGSVVLVAYAIASLAVIWLQYF
jgi:di/tricarboxylate transporter